MTDATERYTYIYIYIFIYIYVFVDSHYSIRHLSGVRTREYLSIVRTKEYLPGCSHPPKYIWDRTADDLSSRAAETNTLKASVGASTRKVFFGANTQRMLSGVSAQNDQ